MMVRLRRYCGNGTSGSESDRGDTTTCANRRSHSDMSEVEKSFERSQPEAGPSRLTMSSVRMAWSGSLMIKLTTQPLNPMGQQSSRLPHGVITFADFLEPYISEDGAKKGKPIPEWIFETSKADQAALDEIQMFGLEYAAPNDQIPQPKTAQIESSPTSPGDRESQYPRIRTDKGKGKETINTKSPSPPGNVELKASAVAMSFPTQTPPVPLAQHVMSTQPASQQSNLTRSPLADNEESESDGDIPVVPHRRVVKPRSRPIFDPLAFPQSSGESVVPWQHKGKERERTPDQEDEAMVMSDDDPDSEDLSDYEREARQQRKRKRTTSSMEGSRDGPKPASHPHSPVRNVPLVHEDESIPASESTETLSLNKRYPSPGKSAVRPVGAVSEIVQKEGVIDHGVHSSLDKNGESLNSNSNGSSLPTPPPSDHDREAPLSSRRSIKIEERPVIPKTERTTVAEHERRRSRSSASVSKIERDGSRSSRTEVAVSRSVESGPSRPSGPYRNRMAGSEPSTSTNISLAQSIRKRAYVLDLTVDGLSTEEVEQYTSKVNAARAKTRTT